MDSKTTEAAEKPSVPLHSLFVSSGDRLLTVYVAAPDRDASVRSQKRYLSTVASVICLEFAKNDDITPYKVDKVILAGPGVLSKQAAFLKEVLLSQGVGAQISVVEEPVFTATLCQFGLMIGCLLMICDNLPTTYVSSRLGRMFVRRVPSPGPSLFRHLRRWP